MAPQIVALYIALSYLCCFCVFLWNPAMKSRLLSPDNNYFLSDIKLQKQFHLISFIPKVFWNFWSEEKPLLDGEGETSWSTGKIATARIPDSSSFHTPSERSLPPQQSRRDAPTKQDEQGLCTLICSLPSASQNPGWMNLYPTMDYFCLASDYTAQIA